MNRRHLTIVPLLLLTPVLFHCANVDTEEGNLRQKSLSSDIPSSASATSGEPVFIRIFKEESELEMWVEGKEGAYRLLAAWPVCKWSGTLGPKLREGDRQSPEGFYSVTPSRMNPESNYHLAFDIGYPNEYDRSYGRTGSAIMVHGICASLGCFAMTNEGIEEIWRPAEAALEGGQPFFQVHIFPFRMTDENMERHKESEWIGFWKNLHEGYDRFERDRRPPEVSVEEGRYVFR